MNQLNLIFLVIFLILHIINPYFKKTTISINDLKGKELKNQRVIFYCTVSNHVDSSLLNIYIIGTHNFVVNSNNCML